MTIVLNLGIRRAVERALKIVDAVFFGFILFLQQFIRIRPRTILLLRQDEIGDYVLFRNFITVVKASERFKDYDITLCGNLVWQELSEVLDKDVVTDFIWLDKIKFQSRRFYKYISLLKLSSRGYSFLIHPTYSRNPYTDTLVRFIKAKQKIGSEGDTLISTNLRGKPSNHVYDCLIEVTDRPIFEFVRNREFFENLIGEPITIDYPHISV
ncbi:MAG: hypothetical protein WAV76_01840, partial [Bacteroidota bacterium]